MWSNLSRTNIKIIVRCWGKAHNAKRISSGLEHVRWAKAAQNAVLSGNSMRRGRPSGAIRRSSRVQRAITSFRGSESVNIGRDVVECVANEHKNHCPLLDLSAQGKPPCMRRVRATGLGRCADHHKKAFSQFDPCSEALWHMAPGIDWSEGKAFAWLICPDLKSGTPGQGFRASVSGWPIRMVNKRRGYLKFRWVPTPPQAEKPVARWF